MSTGGLFVALAGMIVGLSCFSFILYVVYVIGLWKMFEKLGLEGWKSIIPFYNVYVLAGKTWDPKFIIYSWVGIVAYSIVNKISGVGGFIGMLFALIALVIAIALAVIKARSAYYISKAFNYDIVFAVGYFFFPFIFTLILGFGDAMYVGNYFKESGAQY